MSRKLSHGEYTIGWICPLEVEQTAALEMLDEEHDRLSQEGPDHNVYHLGSILGHNVVIAGLPRTGNTSAATVMTQMRMTFRNLRYGLLVGIGGGVPTKTDNGMIRLGDVVVSKPTGQHSGAVQYDHGKASTGQFQRTGALPPPPAILLNAAQDLDVARARVRRDPIKENIQRIDTTIPGLTKYKYPGAIQDNLYTPECIHHQPGLPCSECGCCLSKRIPRANEDCAEEDDILRIVVHRGTIASGELVVKNAILRDQLAANDDLLCFEMEAVGVLEDFPCLVIRGIADYCDSHKNDTWHGFAAAAAAAYARQLFAHIPIEGRTDLQIRDEERAALQLIERRSFEEGAKLLQRVIDQQKGLSNPDHDSILINLSVLQWAYWEINDKRQAERIAREAVEILERTKGPSHPLTLDMLKKIADNLWHQGRGIESALMNEDIRNRRASSRGNGEDNGRIER